MARKKNRMTVLKRQREQRKVEKKELKRIRRQQRKDAPPGSLDNGNSAEDQEFDDFASAEDAVETNRE